MRIPSVNRVGARREACNQLRVRLAGLPQIHRRRRIAIEPPDHAGFVTRLRHTLDHNPDRILWLLQAHQMRAVAEPVAELRGLRNARHVDRPALDLLLRRGEGGEQQMRDGAWR